MTSTMRLAALLSFALLAGCATGSLDPHRPKTIEARAEGGKVRVAHGQRLRIPLGAEWHRSEPPIMAVVLEGAPQPDAQMFTPVRTGQETLKFESAQKTVSYDIEVR
jgi:hypothetical protein